MVEDLISTFMVILAGFGLSTLMLTFEVLFPKGRDNAVREVAEDEQPQQRGGHGVRTTKQYYYTTAATPRRKDER